MKRHEDTLREKKKSFGGVTHQGGISSRRTERNTAEARHKQGKRQGLEEVELKTPSLFVSHRESKSHSLHGKDDDAEGANDCAAGARIRRWVHTTSPPRCQSYFLPLRFFLPFSSFSSYFWRLLTRETLLIHHGPAIIGAAKSREEKKPSLALYCTQKANVDNLRRSVKAPRAATNVPCAYNYTNLRIRHDTEEGQKVWT